MITYYYTCFNTLIDHYVRMFIIIYAITFAIWYEPYVSNMHENNRNIINEWMQLRSNYFEMCNKFNMFVFVYSRFKFYFKVFIEAIHANRKPAPFFYFLYRIFFLLKSIYIIPDVNKSFFYTVLWTIFSPRLYRCHNIKKKLK